MVRNYLRSSLRKNVINIFYLLAAVILINLLTVVALVYIATIGQVYCIVLAIFDLVALLLLYRQAQNKLIKPIEALSYKINDIVSEKCGLASALQFEYESAIVSDQLSISSTDIGALLQCIDITKEKLTRATDLFNSLSENTVAGIYILDENLRFVYASQQIANMLGCDRAVLNQDFPLNRIFSTEELEKMKYHTRQRLSGKQASSNYESSAIRFDGTMVDIEFFGSLIKCCGQNYIVGLVVDITERKESNMSLKRAALIYHHSSEGMVITDKDGVVIDVNAAFVNITGYQPEEVIGYRLNKISAGQQPDGFYENMWASILQTGTWSGDLINRRKSGEEYVEYLRINTVYNQDGSVHSRIGLFSDVTDDRKHKVKMWHQANYDSLTKLPNRQMFQTALQNQIKESKQTGADFALLFLDLDLFKEVNDTFGHDDGDELLKIMAKRLKNIVRENDIVARLGGDEFTVILRKAGSGKDIGSACQKIIDAIAQPYRIKENVVYISASMGVTFYPGDGKTPEALLRNSDLAMYAAKEKGRNQYCFYSPNLQIKALGRLQMIKEIQNALEQNQFKLMLQPVYDMRTETVACADAVIFWDHGQHGSVKANEFIPLAEETGQIIPIGEWVYTSVLGLLSSWYANGVTNIAVNIKVATAQFYPEGINLERWLNSLTAAGLEAGAVNLEISEEVLLEADNSQDVLNKLKEAKRVGFKIVQSGFGTGFCSIAHLKKFLADYIKIDSSYINNLARNSKDFVLCQSIIAMAHELGIQVIAEGVNTKEQHDLLLEAGCDYGLGKFYGKAIAATEFITHGAALSEL